MTGRQHGKGPAGIEIRHTRSCASRSGGNCSCKPTYQAHVWSARDRKRIRKTFPTRAAARNWRQEAQVALRRGTMKAPSRITLREAAEHWLKGALEESIRNRSGDAYKPSAIRGYEQALRLRILPDLGGLRLSEVRRTDLQDLVDRMNGEGRDPSTIRNTLMPLRAIYRRALSRGDVALNPTSALELPAVRGKRERVAAPPEAALLLAALPSETRALWATAMYAGLRLGELRALEWLNVDLAEGKIHVEWAWDPKVGLIKPKSRAGHRIVPIPAVLRDHLTEHRMQLGYSEGFVFGRETEQPFNPAAVQRSALAAWRAAGLDPIGLHECRHTFASLMIAAGVNAKALSTYLGHASVTITLDRYGHLMPGNEHESGALLDAYLERANTAARLAALD